MTWVTLIVCWGRQWFWFCTGAFWYKYILNTNTKVMIMLHIIYKTNWEEINRYFSKQIVLLMSMGIHVKIYHKIPVFWCFARLLFQKFWLGSSGGQSPSVKIFCLISSSFSHFGKIFAEKEKKASKCNFIVFCFLLANTQLPPYLWATVAIFIQQTQVLSNKILYYLFS